MINRSVSIGSLSAKRLHSPNDGVQRIVDMLEVRPEAEDGAPQAIGAVDARAAHHHAAFLLNVAHQSFVELADVARVGKVTKRDDGELRLRPCVEAVDRREARMEITGERELLRLRRAEGGDAGDLQRQPQAQRAEVAGGRAGQGSWGR